MKRWLSVVSCGVLLLACERGSPEEAAALRKKSAEEVLAAAQAACAEERVEDARRLLVEGGKAHPSIRAGLDVAGVDGQREHEFNPCGLALVVIRDKISGM
jgi:hypothetical protein